MAATFTLAKVVPNADFTDGNRRRRIRDVTVAGTYTTGGDALLPSAFGLRQIFEFMVHGAATDGTVSYPVTYIYATNLVKFWESGGAAGTAAAEKGSAESMTGVTFRVTVVGL